MDEREGVSEEGFNGLARISETEQIVRSVLILGCALGVILGLAFVSLIVP